MLATMGLWAGICGLIIYRVPIEGVNTLIAVARDGGKVDLDDVLAVVVNSFVLWAAAIAVLLAVVVAFWTAVGNPSGGKPLMFNQMLALLSALMAASAGLFAIPSVFAWFTNQ
jgi:hypothetical protein